MPQLTSISGTPPATASPPLCTQHPLPARSLASSCPGLHPEASTDTLGRGTALGLQGLGRVAVAEKPAGHSLWQRGIWGRCQACARGASSRARLSPHQPEGLDSRATAPLQLRAPRCPREAGERVLGPKGDQSSPREARPGWLRTSEGAPACSQCARGGARQAPPTHRSATPTQALPRPRKVPLKAGEATPIQARPRPHGHVPPAGSAIPATCWGAGAQPRRGPRGL